MGSKVSQQDNQKTFGIAEILPVFPSRPTLHNQRAQALSNRFEVEAADEYQAAVAELRQASMADGTREIAIVPAATTQRVWASRKATHAQKAARTKRSN
jgi:hypothetical protein